MSDSEVGGEPELAEPSNLHAVVEAIIFGAEEVISPKQIVDIIQATCGRAISVRDVRANVDALNAEYERSGRAFRINEWAGGYRMATDPEFAEYLKALYDQQSVRRLSRSLLETVSIVAYKQPVTKPEVDHVRGVDSDYALRRLTELGLIQIAGRSESVGHPFLYATTADFMDKFGLKSLDDLPTLREVRDVLEDPAFNRERAMLLFKEGLDLPNESDDEDGGPERHSGESSATAPGTLPPLYAEGNGTAHADIDLSVDRDAGNTSNGHAQTEGEQP
jgi:segregation and condensation protein B